VKNIKDASLGSKDGKVVLENSGRKSKPNSLKTR
jgi:hypothetical protein